MGDVIGVIVPGVGSASHAITGINEQGNQMSSAGRLVAAASSALEITAGIANAGRLTTPQATDLAEYLGYRRVKGAPFNSMGQAVYSNGRTLISPDVTSHAGGVWKDVNRSGAERGTFDALLMNRIGN